MNTKLALVLAVVCGFIAVIAVKSWITDEDLRQKSEAEPVGILVANRRLPKGTTLKMEHCKQGLIPKNYVTSGMIPFPERLRFADQIVNRDLDPDRPIFEDFLDNAGKTASLARIAVQPDRRAVTLQVDQVSGVAGLVRPGDYVDVIGTFVEERPATAADGRAAQNSGEIRVTKTVYLLQAARVLAIDNKIVTADVQAGASSRINYRTVTLEVRPEDALRLISANHAGNLQLILRNPGEVNLVPGLEEVKQGNNTVRMKPTVYWDITREVFGTTPGNTPAGSAPGGR